MTKRRKALIITLIILAVIYFLLIGASYLFLKNYVDPTFADRRIVGEYPYSNAAIPEDFAEYAMHGIKLDAPDCMEARAESSSISNYISNDPAQHDLQIIALETDAQDTLSLSKMHDYMKNEHHLVGSWLAGRGWLTELGIKKIGYELPENDNALMYLLEKMDMDDYNKFSLIEAYAFTKLYVLKAIYVPPLLWVDSNDTESTLESPLSVENCSYYIEAGAFKAIVEQSSSKSGRYWLTVRCYPDTEAAKTVIVVSDDPALAQTVVASVRPA